MKEKESRGLTLDLNGVMTFISCVGIGSGLEWASCKFRNTLYIDCWNEH